MSNDLNKYRGLGTFTDYSQNSGGSVNNTTASTALDNTSSTPTDCFILQFDQYVPWNNSDNIVSSQTEDLVQALKDLLFLPVLFLIGCPANIINMIVFYNQGLKERINVCLFALSFADEVYLITNMLWYGDQLYARFTTKEKIGPQLVFLIDNNLVGLHGFIWVSQILSAIIACERCFCVTYPLRSQLILRTSTMTAIIIAVHLALLGLVSFEALRYAIVCVYDPLTGKKMLTSFSSEFYYRHQNLIDYIDVFVLGIGLPGLVMIVAITTTTITAAKLQQAALWRAGTSSSSGGLSERDLSLTKMLVVNSVFFIVCVIPFPVLRFVFLLLPEMHTGGRQHNFYFMIQWILLIISYFNSSLNIFIYYTMGSRYRQTFWQLFGKTIVKDGTTIKNKEKIETDLKRTL